MKPFIFRLVPKKIEEDLDLQLDLISSLTSEFISNSSISRVFALKKWHIHIICFNNNFTNTLQLTFALIPL